MRKIRGFRLGHKLVTVFKWGVSTHPRRKSRTKYQCLNLNLRLNDHLNCNTGPISKLWNSGWTLKQGFRQLCFSKSKSGFCRVGQENLVDQAKQLRVPKGHLAVDVGEKEEGALRILVPVIFFNHPLFGDLLREAENVYGYDHLGGIQTPCRISEFENIQTRIAASGAGGGHCRGRRRWSCRRTADCSAAH